MLVTRGQRVYRSAREQGGSAPINPAKDFQGLEVPELEEKGHQLESDREP